MLYRPHNLQIDLPEVNLESNSSDLEIFVQLCELKAIIDDADALYALGCLSYLGKGLEKNYEKARKYFIEAADNGNANAQYNAYCCYLEGVGGEKNLNLAQEYLKRAAENDQLDAMSRYVKELLKDEGPNKIISQFEAYELTMRGANLGSPYLTYLYAYYLENGRWGKKDIPEAISYYKKCATTYPDAAQHLGLLYYNGELVDKDYKEAFRYFQIASNAGHSSGMISVGHMYAWGCGVEQSADKAIEYYIKAVYSSGGSLDIMDLLKSAYKEKEYFNVLSEESIENLYQLARDYFGGSNNFSKNQTLAFNLFAALAPYHISSVILCAQAYLYGQGIEKDEKKGFSILKDIALKHPNDKRLKGGYGMLGFCYWAGKGTERDYDKAFHYYLLDAEFGDDISMYNVGCCYSHGQGTPVDEKKAVYWYQKAVDAGYNGACYNLALRYYSGRGCTKDYAKAKSLFERSYKTTRNIDAVEYLSLIYAKGGDGIPIDFAKAFQYAKIAADEDSAYGYFLLAWYYAYGKGTPRNFEKAWKYNKIAIELDPTNSEALTLQKKLSIDGKALRPTADLNRVFEEAAEKVVGGMIGGLAELLLGIGSGD